jgi:protein ImuB
MRRVVSVWLPTWPTDRLRRQHGPATPPPDAPLIIRAHDGRRWVVGAADAAARALGLWLGMKLSQAQAMVPGIAIADSDPASDAQGLATLAAWALRYAPMTSADTDGIWIDVTGATHLHGGEHAMLADIVARLAQSGITARVAIADTPGAAHAVARHAGQDIAIVPPGAQHAVLAPLPVTALRIGEDAAESLRRLGLNDIAQLMALPRGPFAHRLGSLVLQRLDQALGHVPEPIEPATPPETIQYRLAFIEPLATAEAFSHVIGELLREVCNALEATGQGARRLDLVFERLDGTRQTICVGTARPGRDARHLERLLAERLDQVDPGLGVEAMHLFVPLAEPLAYAQTAAVLAGAPEEPDLSLLIDRLTNRFGAERVYRLHPVESDVPERSVVPRPALAPTEDASWPAHLPRPVRLFDPPQRIETVGMLPDHPPATFTWRRVRHRVRRADGPERIYGEWWHRDAELQAVRDYWIVEVENGRRFWLFRRGDGIDPATGDLSWFMHGVF